MMLFLQEVTPRKYRIINSQTARLGMCKCQWNTPLHSCSIDINFLGLIMRSLAYLQQ
jgi:hypothetical protein